MTFIRPQVEPEEDRLLNVEEACKIVGIAETTYRERVRNGWGPFLSLWLSDVKRYAAQYKAAERIVKRA